VNFIEPWNILDIVLKVLDFKNWKYSKISKKEFKWEENIEKTLNIYKEVLWK
jgi:hypothetical protein